MRDKGGYNEEGEGGEEGEVGGRKGGGREGGRAMHLTTTYNV